MPTLRTHEHKDAIKMLGLYHYRDAKMSEHGKEMIKNMIDWVDQMSPGKLPRQDAWMSFFPAQLVPGINLGLMAVILLPKELQKSYQDLY